jgi:hypothetical protein
MLMHAFLPILSILGFGLGVIYFISVRFHFRLDYGDFYLISVLVGFASLILPMTLIGILFPGRLGIIPRVHVVCSAILVLLGSYHFLANNLYRLENIRLTFPKAEGAESVLIIMILVFLLEYLFLLLLFPLQGFDALERYFPDALIYYQSDSIPKMNLLTATPTYKEPAHTLLFTYVLYVSGRDTYQLIPFLIIISLTILIYKLGTTFLGSHRNGLLSAALFLALPLTRQLFTVWAYYQDVYIAFFYSVAIYFFLLAFRRENNWYSVLAGIATGLAILSKMSGWTLFFILLLVNPTGNRGKAIKIIILIPVSAFLAMKAIATIYVGIAIAIAIIVFILTALILRMPSREGSLQKTIIPLSVGVFTGSWWMLRMQRVFPQSYDAIIQFYFIAKGAPQWTYPVSPSPDNLPIREHMHSLSFLGTCLILFVSAWFAAGWLIPKLIGFLSKTSETALVIWCLGFLGIWFAYYFLISVRYLSVIILPVALLTAKGTEQLHKLLQKYRIPRLILEVGLLAAATFQIRHHLFLEQIYEPPDHSFTYATNPIPVLIIALGISIIGFAVLIIVGSVDVFLWQKRISSPILAKEWLMGGLLVILLLLTITAPAGKELNRLKNSGWDPDHYAERFLFERRPAVQELVQAIIAQNSPSTSIIGANVPGLEFFVQQPVIDLIWGGQLFFNSFLTEENVTKGLELLDALNTSFIIGLNEENYLYEKFQSEIVTQTYLYHLTNYNHYFQRVLKNTEFTLYRIDYYGAFAGIINIGVHTYDHRASVLDDWQINHSTTTRPTLVATLDLTMKQWTQMTIKSEVNYTSYAKNMTEIRQINVGKRDGFSDLRIFDFPLAKCEITGLKLACTLYDANSNTTEELIFNAEAAKHPLTIMHEYQWTSYNRTSQWSIQAQGDFILS